MEPIIAVEHLSKSFKKRLAVNDLSFSIAEGEVYGFLGQNGAGKSTTMRMLLGLIFPDKGAIFIRGQRFDNSKRHLLRSIGAIIERPDMYGYLSGWDNLKIFATLTDPNTPDARLHEVLEVVGLNGRENDKFSAYSQGMKQRLGIAVAMVNKPDLLILDEPTNGLDPQGIAEIRNLIRSLSKDHGKTILISSHLLHEMELIASSMLVLHRGKKIADGKVNDLLNPAQTLVEFAIQDTTIIMDQLLHSAWASTLDQHAADALVFKLHPDRIPLLNAWIVEQGGRVKGIRSKHSLEDYFLSITHD